MMHVSVCSKKIGVDASNLIHEVLYAAAGKVELEHVLGLEKPEDFEWPEALYVQMTEMKK